jgi:hypothetical protein
MAGRRRRKMALDNEVLRRPFDEEEIHSPPFQIKRTRMVAF